MNSLFLGMACILAAAAGYWIFGRGTPRPAGTGAMGALLTSFAAAFASYAPLAEHAVEAVVPHVARLLSNSASLAAATSVLAISYQVNLAHEEARRRTRSRISLLAAVVSGMTVLFAVEEMTHRSPQVYALYLLLFISYLGFAVIDFLRQALLRSRSSRKTSVRLGFRTAAVGCGFAIVYTVYKLTVLISLGFGFHLVPDHSECSSLVAGPCMFSVTAPALAVLLICVGLTLPAVAYPVAQYRRRRWEERSFEALGTLWQDLSQAMPQIVLSVDGQGGGAAAEPDFLLQRRVIEISDGVLALRPYRSQEVEKAARKASPDSSVKSAAFVEAAIVKDALAAMRAGRFPPVVAAPTTTNASVRKTLRDDTEWLLLVADSYAQRGPLRVADGGQPEPVGA
ncbi:MAB_1171c family putative transporter [Streptomyces sp. NPDC048281]|uniref:MAB_1171c family putative transporter n=1 Tax=Streptomyces sp. NPDC048281 TaxID=3154715 RepID=UPI003434B369